MEEKFEFIFTGGLEVEEAFSDRAVLSGIFLRLNKATQNGREYLIEEADQIVRGLVGMPVYFGVDSITNKHMNVPSHQVGRVIKAVYDRAKKVIRGAVEVWNTKVFPSLVEKIRKGFGFSIGGKAMDLQPTGTLNRIGRAIMRVIGMRPNHLQLLEPKVPRGQQEAKVTDVQPVEESLEFDPCPWGICELPEETTTDEPEVTKPVTTVTEGITTVTSDTGSTVTGNVVTTVTVPEKKAEEPKVETIIKRTVIKRFIKVDDPDSTII